MATLSNPSLSIKLISGTSNAEVGASVHVNLSSFEENLVKQLGLKFVLRCRIMGEDDASSDDVLYAFPGKTVSADGGKTFQVTLHRSVLDEDIAFKDDVYARFTLQSTEPAFPLSVSANSDTIQGKF